MMYPDMGQKLVVIGDSFVGKTHLCLSLLDHPLWKFDDEYPYDDNMFHRGIYKSPSKGTINFPYDDFKDDGKRFRFQIFDRAGDYMVCPHARENYFYEDVSGALLVYDMTNSKSFDHLGAWLEVLKKETFGSTIAITVVGNKSDLANSGSILTETGHRFAKQHGCPFFETSALEKRNVKKAFESVFGEIIHIQRNKVASFNPHAMMAARMEAARLQLQNDDRIVLVNKKTRDKKKPCCKPCCCGT